MTKRQERKIRYNIARITAKHLMGKIPAAVYTDYVVDMNDFLQRLFPDSHDAVAFLMGCGFSLENYYVRLAEGAEVVKEIALDNQIR